MATMTATKARELARQSTQYGYFVHSDRKVDDPDVYVPCPVCKTRVDAWVPRGKRGAHAEVKALRSAVEQHLRAGCDQ